MASQQLVAERQEFGKQILEQLDDQDFDVLSAMWVYSEDFEDWMLILATQSAAINGTKHTFIEMLKNLRSDDLRKKIQTQHYRFAIYDPCDTLFTVLIQMFGPIGKKDEIGGVFSSGNIFNGMLLPTAYIYRLMEPDRDLIVKALLEKMENTKDQYDKLNAVDALLDQSVWEQHRDNLEKAGKLFNYAEQIVQKEGIAYPALSRKLDNYRKSLEQATSKRNAS